MAALIASWVGTGRIEVLIDHSIHWDRCERYMTYSRWLTVVAGILLASSAVFAREPLDPDYRLWLWSQAALAGSSTADIVSSIHPSRLPSTTELNPVTRTPSRLVLTKGVSLSVNLAAQWWVLRHHPQWARRLTTVNFGMAAGHVVVAGWNWRR